MRFCYYMFSLATAINNKDMLIKKVNHISFGFFEPRLMSVWRVLYFGRDNFPFIYGI